MSDSVFEKAFAKLNLSLHILGAKGAYHEIEMLDQTIDLYDEVFLSPRKDDLLVSEFEGDNSLVVLKKLQEEFRFGGVTVSVKKKIPIGGGLGGSSADAAAAALAAAKLFSLPIDRVKEITAPLFGDIAFQMTKGTAIARGMGEIIDPLSPLPSYFVLLCFPEKGVETKEAFRLSDGYEKSKPQIRSLYGALSRGENAQAFYANDLLPAAMLLNGEIEPILRSLADDRALLTGMTGSGSTLFSIYEEKADAEKKAQALSCRTLITRFSRGI